MKYAALLGLLAIGMAAIMAPKIHAQTGGQPYVTITDPTPGDTETGRCNVIFGSSGAYKFEFYVDGSLRSTLDITKSSNWFFTWNTRKDAKGWHTLNVKAINSSGLWYMSAPVDCIVQ